jgi:hypothetical protein
MRIAIVFFAAGAVVIMAILAWFVRNYEEPDPEPPFPFATGALDGCALEDRDGVAVLRLSGSPRAKGRGHGRLLRDAVREWVEAVRPKDAGVADFAIRTCGERLLPFVPGEVREEMEGIAEGAGVTLHEILHLHTRFDLAPFRQGPDPGAPMPLLGDAAVGTGPRAGRGFSSAELLGRTRDLLVVVHEGSPPLVLLALPGMAGGFVALRGDVAATFRPIPAGAGFTLKAASWPVQLRRLVESPPVPGVSPAPPVTFPASVPMARSSSECGTLNLSPAGGTWRPALRGLAPATEEEILPGEGTITESLRAEREARIASEAANRLLYGAASADDLFVILSRVPSGVRASFKRRGRAVVRFTTVPLAGP